MNLEPELLCSEHIPLESLKSFLSKKFPQLEWNQNSKEDVVLDAGCGPGGTTYQLALPLFPNVKKIWAIEFAKKHNSNPLIEYNVANLEDCHEKWCVSGFKADRTTSKRIRYGFITVKSTTLIGLNSPRKNTTLPAIKCVEPGRTHILV
ncbi:methyltransf_25 domain-containing protein [Trichonephila clavipes]|nr:methyltransf_25 domain-containing protein [Trichonephila clavipes]